MDSSLKSKKFGVVHTSPTELLTGGKTLELGKLYFAQGEANGAAKQGIYALTNSTDANGDAELTMFGCGALADESGAGLLSSELFTKISKDYLLESNYVQVDASNDGYVPKVVLDASDSTIDSSTKDWVLAYDSSNNKLGWYKLPANAFLNDKGVTSVTITGGEGITSSSGSAITSTGTRTISLKQATNSSLGGIRLGYTDNEKNYKVQVDSSGNAFVNVPWVDKPADSSHADSATTADKVANSFKVQGDGTDIISFDGSTAKTLNIVAGTNVSLTKDASDGKLTISTTGVPTTNEMNNAINTALTSALKYKGTVANSSELTSADKTKGSVYVASASFTTTATQTGKAYTVEAGDYFISNGTTFDVINGENQVSNENATLAWDTSTKIATVDGTDIYVKLPGNPNSDTWRGVYVDSTSVLGTGTDTSALKFVDGSNIDAYWNSTNKTIQFNHKAPTASDSSKLTKTASSTTSATWGSTDMITGITLMRDVYGHVTDVSISSIQMPSNPNTNKTSKNVVGASASATANAAVTTNGSVYLNHLEDSSVTSSHNIVGSGTVSVTSDANGKITITGADTNTDTKVKDTSVTTKSYILGHKTQGTTAEAETNSSCYMYDGYLYSGGNKVLTSATDTKCTSLTLSADTVVEDPSTKTSVDVILNVKIDASGTGTSLAGSMSAVKVPTQKAIDDAKSAAISEATIYWETL